jgi:glutathione S-transferase
MMGGENKSEEFLKMNPQGTVPVVVDDDFVMNESRAICAYLVNAKSPNHSLYPMDDPKLRFIIDQRLFYDASTLMPAMSEAIVSTLCYITRTRLPSICFIASLQRPILRQGQTAVDPAAKERILKCLNTLEGFLDGFDWFSTTESPCIADLSILANFSTIYHAGLDIADYPNIAGWYERCSSLPGFAENEKGAKMFGAMLKSKLTEPF